MQNQNASDLKLRVMGIDKVDRTQFRRIRNRRFWGNKPSGGLWTSPVESKYGWKDFVESEDYRPLKYLENQVDLELKLSTKLFMIDSFEDYKSAPKKIFPPRFQGDKPQETIDFEKLVQAGYDGLWLTYDGLKAMEVLGPEDVGEKQFINDNPLFGWDVETVLLFNLDCIISC